MRTITLPGLIDSHVHTREPGYPHKATMITEARSAIAGGVTTMCEMPNTDPPTCTIAAFRDKVNRAKRAGFDFRFYFGITKLEHLLEFEKLCDSDDPELTELRKSLCGVKLFFEHSTGDQKIDEELIPEVFASCAKRGILLMAHCEDAKMNAEAQLLNKTRTDVAAHSIIRPAESEAKSIEDALKRVEKYGTKFHIAHISTKYGVQLLRAAKLKGLPVTGEVTTHNLFCSTADYATLGTHIKMNPPIRDREHLEGLAEGVNDGTIDMIVTDHAPHTAAEKANPEPLKAPSGVPGVASRLPLLTTLAAGKWPHPASPATLIKMTYGKIKELCFDNPNNILNLGRKTPEEGGDTITVDPDAEWTISAENLKSNCDWTPYKDWEVIGKVVDVHVTRA